MVHALMILLLSSPGIHSETISGVYEAVSESEWTLTINLMESGDAEVELSYWEAGKHEERVIEKYKGTWRLKGEEVSITYNGITENLRYSKSLSFAELGISGGAPGLSGQSRQKGKRVIGRTNLWLKDALKKQFR